MSGLIMPRRGFLAGLGAILAAPAIVRASSLMPVKAIARGGQYVPVSRTTVPCEYDLIDAYGVPMRRVFIYRVATGWKREGTIWTYDHPHNVQGGHG